MCALDTLAGYYVQLARKEKNKERRKEYFAQVHVPIKRPWAIFLSEALLKGVGLYCVVHSIIPVKCI